MQQIIKDKKCTVQTEWFEVTQEVRSLSHLVLLSVNLEDRDVVLAVDLISGRMFPYTLGLDKSRLADLYTAPIKTALQTSVFFM